MIEYENQTFTSRFKSYNFLAVNTKNVYEWVKTGELSLKDFIQWLTDVQKFEFKSRLQSHL